MLFRVLLDRQHKRLACRQLHWLASHGVRDCAAGQSHVANDFQELPCRVAVWLPSMELAGGVNDVEAAVSRSKMKPMVASHDASAAT